MENNTVKKRSSNFSETEKRILSEIAINFRIIEDKRKNASIDSQKKKAWECITNDFNASELVSCRSEFQLKVNKLYFGILNKI